MFVNRDRATGEGSWMETDPKGLGLADAIEILRAEVASAQLSAIGKDVQFPVQTVTVELRIGRGQPGHEIPPTCQYPAAVSTERAPNAGPVTDRHLPRDEEHLRTRTLNDVVVALLGIREGKATAAATDPPSTYHARPGTGVCY
jgi:hypothetical protein